MGRAARGNYNYTPAERKEAMIKFLKAYAKTGLIGKSAAKAGVSSQTIHKWMEKYPKFAVKVEQMREQFIEGLEMVAIERAKEKSDSLMALLLRANRPEKYRDNVKVDADVKAQHAPVQLVFSPDEWGDTLPNYVGGAGDGGETGK